MAFLDPKTQIYAQNVDFGWPFGFPGCQNGTSNLYFCAKIGPKGYTGDPDKPSRSRPGHKMVLKTLHFTFVFVSFTISDCFLVDFGVVSGCRDRFVGNFCIVLGINF